MEDVSAVASKLSNYNYDDMLHTPQTRTRSSKDSTSNLSAESSTCLNDVKHEVMVNYLYQQQCSHLWVHDLSGDSEGVLLRKSKNTYMAYPPQLASSALAKACKTLNVQCAMTVNSRVIKSFFQWSPNAVDVPLLNGLRIQVLQNIEDLSRARKHQFAAFVATETLLIVWDDEALNLAQRAKQIESELMEIVWKSGEFGGGEKKELSYKLNEGDEESGNNEPRRRQIHLQNTVLVSFTLILVMVTLGAGFRQLAIEVAIDGAYIRLVLLVLTPIQVFFTLFFAQVIIGCLAQILGPIRQMSINSKFYSAQAPQRIRSATLPHVTIQCPVYKEGLNAVIAPTIKSIKQAISTYELQGGSANLFINDDGLQIINEEERRARIEFYSDHNIGWVARPGHSEKFIRKGKCRFTIHLIYHK
ncbi:putative nucleotide-diphospho-sugar transferase [Erysiphe neolycopersici]|uniref:Putative nucleotide-diphospho-sugar transferase n=1 Tax=Erysiphe neolycopersici TaxID=212602 RepID=A0A420HUC7_9PEZI|nr:putative nucleotide-diphospho-sugar transferase [Erysiphe neolycopersici]